MNKAQQVNEPEALRAPLIFGVGRDGADQRIIRPSAHVNAVVPVATFYADRLIPCAIISGDMARHHVLVVEENANCPALAPAQNCRDLYLPANGLQTGWMRLKSVTGLPQCGKPHAAQCSLISILWL